MCRAGNYGREPAGSGEAREEREFGGLGDLDDDDDDGGTVVAVSEGTNRRLAGRSERWVRTSVPIRRRAHFADVCMCVYVCMCVCMREDPPSINEGRENQSRERETESGWTKHCARVTETV